MQKMAEKLAPQQPPADPNEILAQIEGQKVQADIAIAQMKAELEVQKTKMDDDFRRDQLEADVALRAAEIQAKYNTQVDTANIQSMMNRDRDAMKILDAMAQRSAMGQNVNGGM